jgi:hypothetical protein
MRLFHSVIDPGRRWLAKHFYRLRRTLDGLYDRLRDAIAVAVARAAENAVREGVSALLAATPALSPPDYPRGHYPRGNFAPSGGWRDTDEEYDELRHWEEGVDYEREGRKNTNPPVPAEEPGAEPTRLRRALAEGLQAASWWLRRGGRYPVLTSLGAGLMLLCASYVGGPLAGAGIALAGSAMGLLSMGQGTLAAFASP